MVNWDKKRVEFYAGQVLTALLHSDASEELVSGEQEAHAWAEHWSDIAFDIAEVFAAEADNRERDPECRLLEAD